MPKHPQLYITPEQQDPLDELLNDFQDDPSGLMICLVTEELLEESESGPLSTLSINDVMQAFYSGYEVLGSPEQTVADTLKKWEKEYDFIKDPRGAYIANHLELRGKIHGAKYVLDTLGIKLPQ